MICVKPTVDRPPKQGIGASIGLGGPSEKCELTWVRSLQEETGKNALKGC